MEKDGVGVVHDVSSASIAEMETDGDGVFSFASIQEQGSANVDMPTATEQ